MFRLIIDRESVCIGDDVEDHRITMDVGDEMDFRQLLSRLRSIGYFPYVHGNDVVWVMVYGDDTELIAYQTKDGCEYTTFLDAVPLMHPGWMTRKANSVSGTSVQEKSEHLTYSGDVVVTIFTSGMKAT